MRFDLARNRLNQRCLRTPADLAGGNARFLSLGAGPCTAQKIVADPATASALNSRGIGAGRGIRASPLRARNNSFTRARPGLSLRRLAVGLNRSRLTACRRNAGRS